MAGIKFLCCLPLRLGVFLLPLISFLLGGVFSAFGWINVVSLKSQPQDLNTTIVFWVTAGLYTSLGFFAIFGFLGALFKNRGLVMTFQVFLYAHLVAQLVGTAFTGITLFRKDGVASCLWHSATDDGCIAGLDNTTKIVYITIFGFTWVLDFYDAIIMRSYAAQLKYKSDWQILDD